MCNPRSRKPFADRGRQFDFLGEFRARQELGKPIGDTRMKARKWIRGKRQPIHINEPGDIEHGQRIAEKIRLLGEPPLKVIEGLAKVRRRRARVLVGNAVLGEALPELDLLGDLGVLLAADCTRADGIVLLQVVR
jgi:hypothetical protein